VFEAAGAAACLITDAWEGIEQFLEPDVEVLVARDGQDVAEHVATLSAERARAIGQAALARVLAEHTYAHRALEVERVLDAAARRGDIARTSGRGAASAPLVPTSPIARSSVETA
jgi:spore maturation protein CgeB